MIFIGKQLIPLLSGFIIGVIICLQFFYPNQYYKLMRKVKISRGNGEVLGTWNSELADRLFEEIKIVCWIMTSPENHRKKADHVKNTWAKRCNKLVFMSSKHDSELPAVALPVDEGRTNLWDKTKSAFQYVYRNHLEDGDWFLKADDDAYVVMENLRYMLHQYRPQTALYIGHRYVTTFEPYSYMAGGTYILSKKALQKLNWLLAVPDKCRQDANGNEDLEMGKCLRNHTIFVDERDEHQRKRFFPVGIHEHLQVNRTEQYWYWDSMYYNAWNGIDCCSKNVIAFHYVNPKMQYFYEYFFYKVRAFGYQKEPPILPRKLSLQEILKATDLESNSTNFQAMKETHLLDSSENY